MALEESWRRIGLSIALSDCFCWALEPIAHLVEAVMYHAGGLEELIVNSTSSVPERFDSS
jgi:hypothetical protein